MLLQACGVFAPEACGVVLPDHVPRFPGERIGVERLERHAIHGVREADEHLEHIHHCGGVLAHATALHGDVTKPLAQQAFHHETHQRRTLDVHAATPIVHGAHRPLAPRGSLRWIVSIDEKMACVELADGAFHLCDDGHFHCVVLHRAATQPAGCVEDSVVDVAEDARRWNGVVYGDVVPTPCFAVVLHEHRADLVVAGGDRCEHMPERVEAPEDVMRADFGGVTITVFGSARSMTGRKWRELEGQSNL